MANQVQVNFNQYLAGPYREDVMDIMFQITPEDTPFYNMTGNSTASNIAHQWPIRDLTARGLNAVKRGKAYTSATSFLDTIVGTRLTNFCQVIEKLPRVTRTQQALDPVGIKNLMADQMEIRMVEWKYDTEHALIRQSLATGGTNAASQLAGITNAITNGTLYTSTATFNEKRFNDNQQLGWGRGAKLRDCIVGGELKRRVSAFTASSTKFIMSEDKRLVNTVDVYESDFYLVQMHLSRDVLAGTGAGRKDLIMFDRDFFKKAWLRPVERRFLADRSDSVEAVILGEVTLEFGHPGAAQRVGATHSGV